MPAVMREVVFDQFALPAIDGTHNVVITGIGGTGVEVRTDGAQVFGRQQGKQRAYVRIGAVTPSRLAGRSEGGDAIAVERQETAVPLGVLIGLVQGENLRRLTVEGIDERMERKAVQAVGAGNARPAGGHVDAVEHEPQIAHHTQTLFRRPDAVVVHLQNRPSIAVLRTPHVRPRPKRLCVTVIHDHVQRVNGVRTSQIASQMVQERRVSHLQQGLGRPAVGFAIGPLPRRPARGR